MTLIRVARFRNRRERLVLLTAHLAGALDLLLYAASLTLLTSDFRAAVLFSDWADVR